MGIEAIAILLSFTAAAVLLLLVGRLFWILLKIAIIGFLLWFLLTRIYPVKVEPLRPKGQLTSLFPKLPPLEPASSRD